MCRIDVALILFEYSSIGIVRLIVFSLIREKGFASTGGKKQKCSFTLHSDHCTAPRSQLLSSLTKIGVSEQFLSIQLWFFFKSLITSIRRCQLDDYVHDLSFQYWKAVMVFIRSLNSEAFFLSIYCMFSQKSKFEIFMNLSTNHNIACSLVIDVFSKTISWIFDISFSYNLEEW